MGLILRKFKQREDRTMLTMRNGASVLKELIGTSNGKYNPFRIFSAQELKIATNDYEKLNIIRDDGFYKLYKGFWNSRSISVMKFHGYSAYRSCINNIVYASQMSHNHIVRLIGCCLETEIPTLVFESVEYGTLADRVFGSAIPNFEPLLFKNRVKILMSIAHAVAYLHVGFPRPIVFRDIKSSNILFNEENVVKLFDFTLAKSIPEGETHIKLDHIVGTIGHIAPEYLVTSVFNEKSDVYSFGVVLLEHLTGKEAYDTCDENGEYVSLVDHVKGSIENNRLNEIIGPTIVEEGTCEQQLQTFVQLALQCTSTSPEDRPTMVDVARQLRQIYRSCM